MPKKSSEAKSGRYWAARFFAGTAILATSVGSMVLLPACSTKTSGGSASSSSPSAVSSLSGSVLSTSADLSPVLTWSAVQGGQDPVDHYELALGTSAGATNIESWENVGTATTFQFSGLNLSDGDTYYASIRSVDSAGNTSSVTTAPGFTVVTDTPTLSLDFTSGTLNSLVQFTHPASSGTSPGTYFDSAGVLQTVTTMNYILESQALNNASWSKSDTTVGTSSEVTAPDSSTTAEKIVESSDVSASTHQISQNVSATVAQTWTLSVFAQADERNQINLVILDQGATGNYVSALFTLSGSGSVASPATGGNGSGATASIEAYANNWYRCVLTGKPDTTGSTVEAQIQTANSGTTSYAGDGTSGLRAWGAQLEESSSATQYIYTTTSRSAGPRFEYDPSSCSGGTCSLRGLLIEQDMTNYVLQSGDLSNAAWSDESSLAATGDTTQAPDATTTGATLTDSSSSAQSYLRQSITVTNGQTYAGSVFILKDQTTSRFPALELDYTGGTAPVTATVYLNTSTGAVSSPDATYYGVQDEGTYWRLWVIGTNNSTGNTTLNWQLYPAAGSTLGAPDSTATGSIVAWGAQAEADYHMSSYIPTTSSSVLRSSDTVSLQSMSWYDDAGGTFVAQFSIPILDMFSQTNNFIFMLNDGTFNNSLGSMVNGMDDTLRALVNVGGVAQVGDSLSSPAPLGILTPLSSVPTNQVNAMAFAFQANDFALTYNGETPSTTSAGSLPAPTELLLGTIDDYNQGLFGYLRSFEYYPTRLNNASISALTAQ